MQKITIAIAALLATTAWSQASECLARPPATQESLLPALSLQPSASPAWARTEQTTLPRELTDRWSTYNWAVNTAVLAGQSRPYNDNVQALAEDLLTRLRAQSEEDADGLLVAHDYPHRFKGYTFEPPWHSALANGFAAIGLMHLSQVLAEPDLMAEALRYLSPIPTTLASRDEAELLWFEEYVADEMPEGSGVINGHFAALGALQEWRIRMDDCRFDTDIQEGFDTLARWLPRMVVEGQNYFGYSRLDPTFADYGQERAVIQAVAACRVTNRASLCNAAEQYEGLAEQWAAEDEEPDAD